MKFNDPQVRNAIYNAANPKFTAKHYEKTHRREDWGEIIVDAMKLCLSLKYEQSEEFRDALAATAGKYIVEDQTSEKKNKKPNTWGAVKDGDYYVGPNLMGRLLMELRETGHFMFKNINRI